MMKKLLRKIKRLIKVDFVIFVKYRKWYYKYGSRQVNKLKKIYSKTAPRAKNEQKTIFFVCNGRIVHAGLCDRLRGLVAIYKVCKERGLNFKVHWDSPFTLDKYLVPNAYDWMINADEISYNSEDVDYVFYMLKNDMDELADKIEKSHKKQIHVYTNSNNALQEKSFSTLFFELFKLSPDLQNRVDAHFKAIGSSYLGLTFRFQNLMGDFNDLDAYPTAIVGEQQELMEKCLKQVYKERENQPEYPVFLITSDSITFLNEVKKIPFVYVIPGNTSHTDSSENDDYEIHLKTFVDLFMLSKADKIICLTTDRMYSSGFPNFASKLNGVSFERKKF